MERAVLHLNDSLSCITEQVAPIHSHKMPPYLRLRFLEFFGNSCITKQRRQEQSDFVRVTRSHLKARVPFMSVAVTDFLYMVFTYTTVHK